MTHDEQSRIRRQQVNAYRASCSPRGSRSVGDWYFPKFVEHVQGVGILFLTYESLSDSTQYPGCSYLSQLQRILKEGL